MERKGGRKSRAMDPSLKGLKAMCRGMMITPRYMWRANLEFLWDKFITHGPVSAKIVREK